MKIAIIVKGFDQKGGLIDFIRHIIFCIDHANKDRSKKIFLIIPKNNVIFYLKKSIFVIKNFLKSFLKYKKFKLTEFSGISPDQLEKIFADLKNIKKTYSSYTFKSHLVYLQKNKFDIVLPFVIEPPANFKLPWIGYFWDFQHKYYPKFFNKKEIKKRNISSKNMFTKSKNVIVNSNAVKQDAIKFIKNCKSKIHVLPFCPGAKLEWIKDKRNLASKYGIEKPYFIICNQFYVHKNHQIAFKAFSKLLKLEGKKFQLVCTGSQNDSRDREFFSKLVVLSKKLNVDNDIIYTGHIPKIDQISLLKKSIALLQPTLFEGGPGGGSTFDAISLGHRLLVSSIPVNHEIKNYKNINFFDPRSVNDLTNKLLKIINSKYSMKTDKYLLELSKKRMAICGKKIISIAEQIIIK